VTDILSSARTVHLCVDMQRLFSDDGPWPTPWLERVLPRVEELARRVAEATIFTRFMPPQSAEAAFGRWRAYYERWRETTTDRIDPRLIELMPPLARLAPPALVIDKPVYSAFAGTRLHRHLRYRGIDTLVVTGSETDVCVLSTVLGAVDLGYRIVLVTDGVCSSSDEGHDALLAVYTRRLGMQIETSDVDGVLSRWR
jgi:nicotinamidase-related amidase